MVEDHSGKSKPRIVAIFIAYKAEKTLASFFVGFPKDLFDDIILVDDASPDNTFEIAKTLPLRSYKNPVNLGYGGNMKRALKLALESGANIIVDIHPDGEYLPSAIGPALKEIERGADFVLGNRFGTDKGLRERGVFFWKIIPITVLNWLSRTILKLEPHDLHQGFRVYTRRLLETCDVSTNADDFLFSFQLIAQATFRGLRITEVPVETKYEGEKRGATLKHSIKYSLGTLKVLAQYLLAKMGITQGIFKNKLLEYGNLYTKPEVKKSWVIGHFIDQRTPFHEKNFSLKWTKSKKGEKRGHAGINPAKTLDILVYGKHRVNLVESGESVLLEKEGDYIYVGPGIAHTWETLEDSLIVTLRWPSTAERELL